MKAISNEQGLCPICNSENLSYDTIELIDDMLYYPWKCEDCSAQGEEWYKLNFSGHNIIDEDGITKEVR